MKQRRAITFLLLFVSLMVLAIEAVPHHHHRGVPCFGTAETEQPNTEDDGHHSKSECDCLASFYAAEKGGHTHHESYCNHFPSITLFGDLVSFCLMSEESIPITYSIFIESLHATHVSCAIGLRAPPVFA